VNAPLSGPGLGLPLPTNLYPSELNSAPYDFGTNKLCLAPGENITVPAGDWFVGMGGYLVLQYRDPNTNLWAMSSGAPYNRGLQFIKSDGFNVRIANLTGCPVSAIISSQGANYVQSTTFITATGGTSTWQPIVGGALAFTGGSVASVGGGYGIAPLMLIPDPPPYSSNSNGVGGVAASGYVGISSGTVVLTGVTFTNQGAGYPSAPANFALLPVPSDPNLATGITLATVAFSLTNSGLLTGVLCTNPGAPLVTPSAITLAVTGAGVTGTVSAVVMQTITAASVAGAGVGYVAGSPVFATGGVPPQGTITGSPDSLYLAWFPRPVNITIGAGTVGALGTIYDGGLFLAAPTAAFPPTSGATGTVGTVAFTMGSKPDIAVIQPAP
jgi:hypothetical protein